VRRPTSEYLTELQTSTTPLDVILGALRNDAITRFKAGQKQEAKAYFREGVRYAIQAAHKDGLESDSALHSMFSAMKLVEFSGFEEDLDRIIKHVLEQAKRY
jgi:hypothetical protein